MALYKSLLFFSFNTKLAPGQQTPLLRSPQDDDNSCPPVSKHVSSAATPAQTFPSCLFAINCSSNGLVQRTTTTTIMYKVVYLHPHRAARPPDTSPPHHQHPTPLPSESVRSHQRGRERHYVTVVLSRQSVCAQQ